MGDNLGASTLSNESNFTDLTSSNLSDGSLPPALAPHAGGASQSDGDHDRDFRDSNGDFRDNQSRSSAYSASQRFQAGALGASEELDEFGAMLAVSSNNVVQTVNDWRPCVCC